MGVHTFPKGISPKGNMKDRLELKHAYFKATVLHFIQYALGLSDEF